MPLNHPCRPKGGAVKRLSPAQGACQECLFTGGSACKSANTACEGTHLGRSLERRALPVVERLPSCQLRLQRSMHDLSGGVKWHAAQQPQVPGRHLQSARRRIPGRLSGIRRLRQEGLQRSTEMARGQQRPCTTCCTLTGLTRLLEVVQPRLRLLCTVAPLAQHAAYLQG